MTERPDDLPDIKAALVARLESLAEAQLGAPTLRKGRTWRWGSKGSIAVVMFGDKRGSWHDHEAMMGGGPLDLIMLGQSCKLSAAIEWARQWLGMTAEQLHAQPKPQRAMDADAAARAERVDGIARARKKAYASIPVSGTLGETYMTRTRGIPVAPWPPCVRFLPALQALLLVATDGSGACQAVQAVLLNDAADKISGRLAKISTGPLDGAAVRLSAWRERPEGAPLVLAEGPETGLTAWAVAGYETWITLGSMAKAKPPEGRDLIVCRDDDPPEIWHAASGTWRPHPATVLLDRTVTAWREAGHRVAPVLPWRTRRHDKSDLNDVVREAGADAVRSRIERGRLALETNRRAVA